MMRKAEVKKSEVKKSDNRGVAMMVCITIIAVLMIFCFSLLAVTYSLYSSQNNRMQADKNAEAAKSLSMALREELTEGSASSNLCRYVRYNIVAGFDKEVNNDGFESWPHYNGNNADQAKRYFKLHKSETVSFNGSTKRETISVNAFPSDTEVCIWCTSPGDNNEDERPHLFVEVECRSGSQSYTVCSEYELRQYSTAKQKLPLVATQTGINPHGNKINRNYIWKWMFIGSE